MRAARLIAVNRLELVEIADPTPSPGEVVVALETAALNHRDVWIKQGQYAGLKFPVTPGSDGAGIVAAVGADVEAGWVGREVIINPGLNWGPDWRAQSEHFNILGLPRDGTLAERVAVPFGQLAAKPPHLSWVEAAALPLAGLTAWRSVVTRAQLRAGERVLVTGIGGGVALYAVQFAVAVGAEVWVTSSSRAKIDRAVTLGARGGFNYAQDGWVAEAEKVAGHFDVIVDSAGGDGFDHLIDLAAPGGRIVFFGATRGNPPGLALRKVFWRQLSLLGTTLGSPDDFGAMTRFVVERKLRPVVSDVLPLGECAEAFALMERGAQCGKIVVQIR
jgi:NADPH:quinone reductase-like Zn-dependent oxidoreductase